MAYAGPPSARVPTATLALTAFIVALIFTIAVLIPTYFVLKRPGPIRAVPFIGISCAAYLAFLLGGYVAFRFNWDSAYGPIVAILAGGLVLILSFWQIAIAGTWLTALLAWPLFPAYAHPLIVVLGVAALPIAILWCGVGANLSMSRLRDSRIRVVTVTTNALGAVIYFALFAGSLYFAYEFARAIR